MTDVLTSTVQAAKRIILSVGSGDGSQQVSIVQSGHHNLITAFFDSEKTVNSKYKSSRDHIALLRKTSTVLFCVNATKLHQHPDLKDEKFNIILFSFPHTGVPNYIHGHRGPNPKSIEGNKQLIQEFLSSAQHILATDGQINSTLKTSSPYENWTFPNFAKYEIEPKSQQDFNSQLFPGYTHQSTKGIGSVSNGKAKTFIFGKKHKHQADGEEEKGAFDPTSSFTLSIEFTAVSDGDIETIGHDWMMMILVLLCVILLSWLCVALS